MKYFILISILIASQGYSAAGKICWKSFHDVISVQDISDAFDIEGSDAQFHKEGRGIRENIRAVNIISKSQAKKLSFMSRVGRFMNMQGRVWRKHGVLWIVAPDHLLPNTVAFRHFRLSIIESLNNGSDRGLVYKLTSPFMNPVGRFIQTVKGGLSKFFSARAKAFALVMEKLEDATHMMVQGVSSLADQVAKQESSSVSGKVEFKVAGNLLNLNAVVKRAVHNVEQEGEGNVSPQQLSRALAAVSEKLKNRLAAIQSPEMRKHFFESHPHHPAALEADANGWITIRPLGTISVNHRVWVNVVLNYLFDHSSQSNADTAEPQSSDPSFLSRPLLVIELIRVSVGDDIRVAIDSFDLENHLAKMLEQELGTSSF